MQEGKSCVIRCVCVCMCVCVLAPLCMYVCVCEVQYVYLPTRFSRPWRKRQSCEHIVYARCFWASHPPLYVRFISYCFLIILCCKCQHLAQPIYASFQRLDRLTDLGNGYKAYRTALKELRRTQSRVVIVPFVGKKAHTHTHARTHARTLLCMYTHIRFSHLHLLIQLLLSTAVPISDLVMMGGVPDYEHGGEVCCLFYFLLVQKSHFRGMQGACMCLFACRMFFFEFMCVYLCMCACHVCACICVRLSSYFFEISCFHRARFYLLILFINHHPPTGQRA